MPTPSAKQKAAKTDNGSKAEQKVSQINERLKAAGVPVRVRLNGKVLGLRATLPLKVGTGRKQQDIRMGIPTTKEGFEDIETEAYKLADQIKRKCQRLQALADYADKKVDLLQYQGKYGAKSAQPRDIPPDELIEEWHDRIPNASWQCRVVS
ncbi:integrase protein [Leptolyngbya sp. NIES-3755]|nr:integrase protein [Leptolyngbya sp. NIES-3755]